MLGFSIADAVAIVTLLSGLALTAFAVRRKLRSDQADPFRNLPEVHPSDTLIRALKGVADASIANVKCTEQVIICQTNIGRQLERIADQADKWVRQNDIDREIAERLEREQRRGRRDG